MIDAFLSHSVNNDNKSELIIKVITKALKSFDIEPRYTVGKNNTTNDPPVKQMVEFIKASDLFVIICTPKYSQTSILKTSNDIVKLSMSEVLYFELGLATAYNKPILAFVKNGTHVNSLLSHLTYFIELDFDNYKKDLEREANWNSIIKSARDKAVSLKNKKK